MASVLTFLVWFPCINAEAEEYNKSATEFSLTEQLGYTTVRIEAELPDNRVKYGTGFFYQFAERDSTHIPAIVTNKHVIRDAILGSFYMTFADSAGNPIHGSHEIIQIDNFENRWIGHPDPTIDLAAMPLAFLLHRAESMNVEFFFRTLGPDLIPDGSSLQELSAVEDILMVGYPNSLWDRANNLPIYRSGITATHPAMDYNGRPEFMIDAACFPGSSGSPVFLLSTRQ